MSSTTRVGFLVPAIGDFADETIYYDNNVTVYETELPSKIVSSLPGSGNYAGRIQTVNSPASGLNPALPMQNYVYTGSGWANLGAFGFKKRINSQQGVSVSANQTVPITSGTEVFVSAPMDGINAIQLSPSTAYRFHCQTNDTWFGGFTSGQPGPTMGFTGKMNIFINPNSSSQPTPTTPGVVRLSAPINISDKDVGNWQVTGEGRYCELLYSPNTSVAQTAGLAAYISATKTDPNALAIFGNNGSISGYSGFTIYPMNIKIESLGLL